MIKLVWRFALLVLVAFLFAWLADHPSTLSVHVAGRVIETSLLVAAVILGLATMAMVFVWSLAKRLWHSPRDVKNYWFFRRNRKAYESLSRGIIAAGAGDAQAASKHAAIAEKTLIDEPLAKVLAAQAAQLRGDRPALTRIFQDMADHDDTRVLGLRGLFTEARATGDHAAAQRHAEAALKINPNLAWASSAVLQLQTARKDWTAAAITHARTLKHGGKDAARQQAALLAAEALSLEDQNPQGALNAALKAHRLDPALVPAALVAARAYINDGRPRKAMAMLRDTWALTPHPDLAEVAGHVKPGGAEPRFERVRDFVGNTSDNVEAAFALARAGVAAQRWDAARKTLEPHLVFQPQSRLCSLMAEIEEAEGDKGKAREWLARALHAPRDPMWVSDGVASHRWTAVSPVTGDIAPAEWKPPYETMAPRPIAEDKAEARPEPPVRLGKPKTVEPQRPPDDPGLDDETGRSDGTVAGI